jgi:integrase
MMSAAPDDLVGAVVAVGGFAIHLLTVLRAITRPSRTPTSRVAWIAVISLTFDQASALLAVTEGTRMHAYISLCLATGIRTEEARELRWDHVSFGDPTANPPAPASATVWRSIRADGDTKTEKSRRTLGLPQMAVDALPVHKKRQVEERLATGAQCSEGDLVFATRTGGALDAANVRREFKAACRAAKIGDDWTPRELRHSFVSLMSTSGVPVEEIARLAGHSNTRTTEVVYRRELRQF